ncbi:MAG: hypothetical protein ACFE8L_01725 [Candidatus Hodarchaeota archaeon]
MESDKIEIVDFSGEKLSLISIPCYVSLPIICILAILNIFFMVSFPGSLITVLISTFLILIMAMYFINWINNPPKLRKFSISEEKIEILLPDASGFHKYWSEFDKIEVRLKILEIKPYKAYQLYFLRDNSEDCFTISLLDFHKEKINEILALLKEYSWRKDKTFSAVKETMICGIVEVEDLNI